MQRVWHIYLWGVTNTMYEIQPRHSSSFVGHITWKKIHISENIRVSHVQSHLRLRWTPMPSHHKTLPSAKPRKWRPACHMAEFATSSWGKVVHRGPRLWPSLTYFGSQRYTLHWQAQGKRWVTLYMCDLENFALDRTFHSKKYLSSEVRSQSEALALRGDHASIPISERIMSH